MKTSRFYILFLFVISCIEPYEFVIHDNTRTLVIEGFLSDKSFTETLTYPSDGRYFSIKLSYTGDVTNVRPEPVRGATVTVISDAGDEWLYSESTETPGIYKLLDSAFAAQHGVEYKLRVSLLEDVFESGWEKLPYQGLPEMGEIGFSETQRQVYVVEASEHVLKTVKEITANITVPANTMGQPVYYRWKFSPMWIYKPPKSPGRSFPGHTCWVTDSNYINTYALQEDHAGGYKKDLFSMPTIRNERIFEDFSVLVNQYAVSQKNYTFWKDVKDQNESSALLDIPPYNTLTNIKALEADKKVIGFFGVVNEQARRWYFNKKDLSYMVVNTLFEDCSKNYGPPLPGCPVPGPPVDCACKYCPEYWNGTPTEVRPVWWR